MYTFYTINVNRKRICWRLVAAEFTYVELSMSALLHVVQCDVIIGLNQA